MLHEAAVAAAVAPDAAVGGALVVIVVQRFPSVETSGVGVGGMSHRLLF